MREETWPCLKSQRMAGPTIITGLCAFLYILNQKQKTSGNRHRLLIIDGHSSYLSIEFIEFCLNQHIHLFCLPSHSTRLLQPLDIWVFSPLKNYYCNLLDSWTRTQLYCNGGAHMKVYRAVRTNSYSNVQLFTRYTSAGFERPSKLRIIMHFFMGPEASTVPWLFLVLCGRTAESYTVDSTRSPSSLNGG